MKIIFFALFALCLVILVQGLANQNATGKPECIKKHREEMKSIKAKISEAFKACGKDDQDCQRAAVVKGIKEAQVALKECLKGTGAE